MRRAAFRPTPTTARDIRAYVYVWLAMADAEVDIHDALLLAGELATLAIAQARTSFEVWVDHARDGVRVGVDHLRSLLAAGDRTHPDDPGGWGLMIVDAVADRWGIESTPDGTRVWFELRARPDGAASPPDASPPAGDASPPVGDASAPVGAAAGGRLASAGASAAGSAAADGRRLGVDAGR